MKGKSKIIVVLCVSALCACYLPCMATAALNAKVLEEKLAKAATYDYGQSREILTEIGDITRDSYENSEELKKIEKQFVGFLRSDATFAAKQFICKQLSIIGTEESVPALAAMLTNAKTTDISRYALERIPGAAVDEALQRALVKTSGKTKVGIINTLGMRRDSSSVGALSKLLDDSDSEVAGSAMAALGRIGNAEAAERLAGARTKVSPALRAVVGDAYLKCADQFMAVGKKARALEIYKQLYVPGEAVPIRSAALAGMIGASRDKGVDIVVEVLKGNDAVMQTVAIGLVREIRGKRIIEAASAELPNLPAAGQVQLLSALADRADVKALQPVVRATKSSDKSVRIAALNALMALGNETTVELLAKIAAETAGSEQQAARQSLYRLRGPRINGAVIAGIEKADSKIKIELIRSIEERRITAGTRTLFKNTKDSNARVRTESIKVLKTVAEPAQLPKLVEVLINGQSQTERREAEKTVVAVAQKIGASASRAEAVLAALPAAEDVEVRGSLLAVLGRIGDSAALPVLREALTDSREDIQAAAIRALSDWPDAGPVFDLLKVAQESENQRHRVLALRGFVGLLGRESDRPAEETIKMYKQAMKLAPDVSEKKMVLSGLANMKSPAALQMAVDYLGEESLVREAAAAAAKIAESTYRSNPRQTKEALKEVIKVSKSAALSRQARRIMDQIK